MMNTETNLGGSAQNRFCVFRTKVKTLKSRIKRTVRNKMDKGFKLYLLFFLWMGIFLGIPSLIFDCEKVWLCGIIAMSAGIATIAFLDQAKENTFRKEMPVTYMHFWMFLAYAVSGMFVVGFSNLPYDSIRSLGRSLTFYAALPVVVFIIECFIKDKKEKRQ